MKKYVCGFLFSKNRKVVALIHKENPEWQKGLWNGIGGKIEVDQYDEMHWESRHNAMSREFQEETGVYIPSTKWEVFYDMENINPENSSCSFFKAFDDKVYDAVTTEIEIVDRFEIINGMINIVKSEKLFPNLSWLIPLALDDDHIYSGGTYALGEYT